MGKRRFVMIQVETWLPRPSRRDPTKMTKELETRWINVCRASVLFADKNDVVVRQLGSISHYGPRGEMRSAGYNASHPGAHKVPEKHGWWRINPKSMERLNGKPLPPNSSYS